MEQTQHEDSIVACAARALRASLMAWLFTAILPLPIVATIDPASNAMTSCLYLGIACGWLAAEITRGEPQPELRRARIGKLLAICAAVGVNVGLFTAFGVAADVQTSFPFSLMAALSAVPSIGTVPWLVRRVHQPYVALLLAGLVALGAKLAACVVARVVYGPDFIAQGYVAADWRTAKLMISIFWVLLALLSVGMLLTDILLDKPSGRKRLVNRSA